MSAILFAHRDPANILHDDADSNLSCYSIPRNSALLKPPLSKDVVHNSSLLFHRDELAKNAALGTGSLPASSFLSYQPRKPSTDRCRGHLWQPHVTPYDLPFISFQSSSKVTARSRNPPQLCRRQVERHNAAIKNSPLSHRDRYVPQRFSSESLSKAFRTGRDVDHLTAAERLLRSSAASESPFSANRQLRIQQQLLTDGGGRANHTDQGFSPIAGRPIRRMGAHAIWNMNRMVQINAGPIPAISDGSGRFLGSGTNAPFYSADFFPHEPARKISERFENKIAAALDIDQTSRIIRVAVPDLDRITGETKPPKISVDNWWESAKWSSQELRTNRGSGIEINLPVLDAPGMRDDFYCSVLALCPITRTLAVGLANNLYLWSEKKGVSYPPQPQNVQRKAFISSISFSSGLDGNNILAVGRSNGMLSLWALGEDDDKFKCQHPCAITCVSFKPVPTRFPIGPGAVKSTEQLLVGDHRGTVYLYSIEWNKCASEQGESGNMTLLARIDIHTQQVCGIAWSPDGDLFATGGNDNLCLLFAVTDIDPKSCLRRKRALRRIQRSSEYICHQISVPRLRNCHSRVESRMMKPPTIEFSRSTDCLRHLMSPALAKPHLPCQCLLPELEDQGFTRVTSGQERQKWVHAAAIKAIAFCPWQRGLLAVGGGTNDRAIHFYHAWSGACLATINVFAQVTSLIWSNRRREIVATFGYPQPGHSYRIAVFSWPDCEQILAVPWQRDTRALYAIAYPGGPNDPMARRSSEGQRWWKRTDEEGSIMVASSDECIKFHEVWSERARKASAGPGCLGWSTILEGLEGVDCEDNGIIR